MHKFQKTKLKKRILSVVLTVGMVLAMLPVAGGNRAEASSALRYYTVPTSSTASTRAVRGVVDDISELPQAKYDAIHGAGSWKGLPRGSVNRPFTIVEVVPHPEFAEFGYLIEGCEPINLEDLHTSWFVSDVDAFLGSYFDYKQSAQGAALGTEGAAYFFKDEKEAQASYYNERGTTVTSLPEKKNIAEFDGYYEVVGNGKGNFIFNETTGLMEKKTGGNIVWHTLNPYDKKYVTYTFAAASTMEAKYFKEVGDRYYTHRQSGEDDPYVDAGGYYYFYKSLDPFVTDVVGLTADKAPTYSVVIKTITPDQLTVDWVNYADLIYINPKSHNQNYIDKFTKKVGSVYANRLNIAPSSSTEAGFGSLDISFEVFKRIFERACAIDDYIGLVFDYTMKDNLNTSSVSPWILDFDFQKTYYYEDFRTSSSDRGVSDNLGKLWVMCFTQNMNITKKMFWDQEKIINKNGKAYMTCQEGNGNSASVWSEGNFLLIDPDTSKTANTYNILTSSDLWSSWNATTNINDNDYAFNHVYGYNGNNSLTQSFVTDKSNVNNSRFDEFNDYVKNDPDVKRIWESHNPGKDFDREMAGKYADNIAPSAALRYILGMGDVPSSSFGGTLRVLNVEPSVGVTSTYGQDWKVNSKKNRIQMMLPNFLGNIELTCMTMGSFVGRTEDLGNSYDLIYFGNETDGFWKNAVTGKTEFVDDNLDGRIYSHVGDLLTGGKNSRIANFVGASSDEYNAFQGSNVMVQRQLDTSQFSVDYKEIGTWDNPYGKTGQVQLTIKNKGTKALEGGWTLSFDSGTNFDNAWGSASLGEHSDNHFVLIFNGSLGAGATTDVTLGWGGVTDGKAPTNYSISYAERVTSVNVNQKTDWLRFPGNDITKLKVSQIVSYMEGGHPVVAHADLFDASLMDQASYIYNFLIGYHTASSTEAVGTKRVYKPSEATGIEKSVRTAKIEVTFDQSLPIRYVETQTDANKYLPRNSEGYAVLQFKGTVDDANAYGYHIYVDKNRNAKFEEDEKVLSGDINSINWTSGAYKFTKEMVGFVQWRIEVYKKSNSKLMRSEEGCSAIKFDPNYGVKNQIHVLQIAPDDATKLNADLTTDTYKHYYENLDAFEIDVTLIKYSDYSKCFEGSGFKFAMGSAISSSNPSQGALDAVNQKFLDATGHRLDYYNMIIVGFADAYGQQDLSNEYGAAEYLYYFAMNNQGSILFTHDNTSLYNTPGTGYTANTMMRDIMGMNRYGTTSTNANSLRTGLASDLEGYRNILGSNISGFTYDEPVTYKDGNVVRVSQTQGFTINALHKMGDPANADQLAYKFRFPYKYMVVDVNGGTNLFNDGGASDTGFMTGTGSDEAVCATTKAVRLNQGQITEYPYNIGTQLNVASTHTQWYQLNMEDPEVTVWYTLEYDGKGNNTDKEGRAVKVYSALPQDASNNYYIYSKDNIFYSGVGHSNTDASIDEIRLFVNTMIAAYRPGAEPPIVEVTNEEAVKVSDEQYKIRVPQELNVYDGSGPVAEGVIGDSTIKVYFRPIDFSLADNISVQLYYEGTSEYITTIYTSAGDAMTASGADGNFISGLRNSQEYYFVYEKSLMNTKPTVVIEAKNNKVNGTGKVYVTIARQPLFKLD